jgi:hypothetical protein
MAAMTTQADQLNGYRGGVGGGNGKAGAMTVDQ